MMIIDILLWVVIGVLLVWQMWVGFVAVMHLRKIRDTYGLTKSQKALGYPTLVFYALLDVFLRCTVFLLMDPKVKFEEAELGPVKFPVPETVSSMLERHAINGEGWRKDFAIWIREDWLADFDPSGGHGDPGR